MIRYFNSEPLEFCHTFQAVRRNGVNTAYLYRMPIDSHPLVFDSSGPLAFDYVDTSDAFNHLGPINVLIAAGPLLKDVSRASMGTEIAPRGTKPMSKSLSQFEQFRRQG